MAATIMQQEIQEYFADLNESDQKHVLDIVKNLLAEHDGETGRISIEQYNKEIDEALADVAAGRYYTQEEVERQSAQWHKR